MRHSLLGPPVVCAHEDLPCRRLGWRVNQPYEDHCNPRPTAGTRLPVTGVAESPIEATGYGDQAIQAMHGTGISKSNCVLGPHDMCPQNLESCIRALLHEACSPDLRTTAESRTLRTAQPLPTPNATFYDCRLLVSASKEAWRRDPHNPCLDSVHSQSQDSQKHVHTSAVVFQLLHCRLRVHGQTTSAKPKQ